MNKNVWLLFCCQALMNAMMAGQVVMASLIGHSLAVDKTLNTLPMAIQMTGDDVRLDPGQHGVRAAGTEAGLLARLPVVAVLAA